MIFNLWWRKQMEYVEDYQFTLRYDLMLYLMLWVGSLKSVFLLNQFIHGKCLYFKRLYLFFDRKEDKLLFTTYQSIQLNLWVIILQHNDLELKAIRKQKSEPTISKGWIIHINGELFYLGRMVVPNDVTLWADILLEAHRSHYIIHLGIRRCWETKNDNSSEMEWKRM